MPWCLSRGLSVSLGGRIDGVPVEDLVNGGDANFRRPGYSAFVDPGLDLSRGSNTFTLNVPVRVYADRRANLCDRAVTGSGRRQPGQVACLSPATAIGSEPPVEVPGGRQCRLARPAAGIHGRLLSPF